jgi:hypothetical protein
MTVDDQDADIRITPAQRAYLAAFDVWLKHGWAAPDGARAALERDTRRAKDRALLVVLADKGSKKRAHRPRRPRPAHADCAKCGRRFKPNRRGRPRKYCVSCTGTTTVTRP